MPVVRDAGQTRVDRQQEQEELQGRPQQPGSAPRQPSLKVKLRGKTNALFRAQKNGGNICYCDLIFVDTQSQFPSLSLLPAPSRCEELLMYVYGIYLVRLYLLVQTDAKLTTLLHQCVI